MSNNSKEMSVLFNEMVLAATPVELMRMVDHVQVFILDVVLASATPEARDRIIAVLPDERLADLDFRPSSDSLVILTSQSVVVGTLISGGVKH
ncbi:MAG: hypothetical protein Q8Q57_12470 [Methylotenera sp.]|nr:hypothetical protein [Methylotenera sp.]